MARYNDTDNTIKAIRSRFQMYFEVPCDEEDKLVQKTIHKVIEVIQEQPTADVVPKSEVDLYKKLNDELEDELASTYDKLEKLEHILDCYALQYGTVTDQQKVIDKAKSEVAREIFEEIEKYMVVFGDTSLSTYFKGIGWKVFAELKKKYTEGEDNQ